MNEGLPTGWAACRLGDLIELQYGKALPAKVRDSSGPFAVYGSNGCVGNHSKALVEGPSIIVGRKGTAGAVAFSKGDCWPIDTTYFVRPPKFLDIYFLFHLLRSLRLEDLDRSTAIPGLNRDAVYAIGVSVPPLAEQRRIVEKIETLFARLEKGEEALRGVQKLLARYRQSVLKSAVTGQLTAKWRPEIAHRLEHGRDLLARILKARQETWQGRGKYKEPAAPHPADLPELPEGWVWATFDQLFRIFGGATPSRRDPVNWNGDIPWVSSGEVAFCRIKDTSEKITDAGYESCSTKLHPPGTVLLAMIGEGRTRGQAAILDIQACNNQNAAAIRVSESGISSEYVYYFLMSSYDESRRKGQGGNQPALNGEKVKRFALPLPSIDEMNEIITRVEEAFSKADAVEKWCDAELARSASLRQAILKDAFAGRLVPQDPVDEPAADLLARITEAGTARPRGPASRAYLDLRSTR